MRVVRVIEPLAAPVPSNMAAGSHITFAWSDAWGFFKRLPEPLQSDFLKQIDLPDMLKFCSIKVRQEVLAEAPQHIRDAIIGGNTEMAFHTKPTNRDKLIGSIMGNWAH